MTRQQLLRTMYDVIGEPPSLRGGLNDTSSASAPTTSNVANAGGSGTVTSAFARPFRFAITPRKGSKVFLLKRNRRIKYVMSIFISKFKSSTKLESNNAQNIIMLLVNSHETHWSSTSSIPSQSANALCKRSS